MYEPGVNAMSDPYVYVIVLAFLGGVWVTLVLMAIADCGGVSFHW